MILFGASGHGKVIADIIRAENRYELEYFLDDAPKCDSFVSTPIYKAEPNLWDSKEMIISVGTNSTRKKITERLQNVNYVNTIHPSAVISPYTSLGKGIVVMANVVVNNNVKIGNHVILNTSCTVDHDCIIEDYAHISPGANLAGDVTVKEGAQIGIGASVIQGVEIGKFTMVGAGAVVIRDVPDYCTVVGNPARIIKTNKI